jgi:23S rRNA pseudouridine2605 synthase
MSEEELAKLRHGMHLAEGFAKPRRIRIVAAHPKRTVLEMTLDEGRNREIRRLLARVGHKVQRLTRIAIGSLRLGELPRGAYRQLRRDEVEALRRDIADSRRRHRAQQRSPGSAQEPTGAGRPRRKKVLVAAGGPRMPGDRPRRPSARASGSRGPASAGRPPRRDAKGRRR